MPLDSDRLLEYQMARDPNIAIDGDAGTFLDPSGMSIDGADRDGISWANIAAG
jgi:hypothetical protein